MSDFKDNYAPKSKSIGTPPHIQLEELTAPLKPPIALAEHVSGAERQNFPLIAQLHLLRESRSLLRSRSDNLPLTLHLIFWIPLTAHRYAPLTATLRSAPLRSAPLTTLTRSYVGGVAQW